jgi:4-diphosphocytidyl-2-C-methyl-D-erythritol kinase
VPWGAGMGGGSSDAASTLLALNRLWGLNWPLERLMPLGLGLGADVPFFLGGENAWVEGIGEQLSPIPVPPQWLAVVKPAAAIETRAIFTSPLLARNTEPAIVAGFLATPGVDALLEGYGRNDLQPPAEQHCSEVTQAASWLEARFGNSRMTGSGSAVFARAGRISGSAVSPKATLPADLPTAWVGRMCRSLSHHPLRDW